MEGEVILIQYTALFTEARFSQNFLQGKEKLLVEMVNFANFTAVHNLPLPSFYSNQDLLNSPSAAGFLPRVYQLCLSKIVKIFGLGLGLGLKYGTLFGDTT